MGLGSLIVNILGNNTGAIRAIQGVTSSLNGLNSKIKSIMSGIKTIVGIAVGYCIGKLMQLSTSTESTLNRINMVFGESAKEIKAWASHLEKAFGVDANNLLSAMGRLGVSFKGAGVAGKELDAMSKSLSLLAYDMSSLYGLSYEAVLDKFMSGLRGETEAIEDLAINISATALGKFANTKFGIEENISELSDLDLAYLRYNKIMSDTEMYQGYYTKSLDTVGAKYNSVTTSIKSLGRAIGTTFAGLFSFVYPVIDGILKLVTAAVNSINGLFGFKPVEIDFGGDSASDSLGGMTEGLGDVEDGAKKASKATKALAGFDDLVTLNSGGDTKADSNKGLIGVGDSANFTLPTIDWGTPIQKETASVEEQLKGFVDRVNAKMNEITGRTVDFGFNGEDALASLNNIMSNITSTLKGVGTLFIDLSIRFLDDINIGSILNSLLGTLESGTKLIKTAFEALKEPIINFYEIALKPVVEWIGVKLKDALSFASLEMDKWSAWFVDNKDLIFEFTTFVAELCVGLWELIEPLMDVGWEIFKDVLAKISELIREIMTWVMENKEAVLLFFTTLAGILIAIKIDGMISSFMLLFTTLGGGAASVLPALIGMLSQTRLGMIASSVATNLMAGAQAALNLVMNLNPIALVIGAIVGLVAGLAILYKNSESFRELVGKLWESMKVLGDYIAKAFVGAWNYLGEVINVIKEKFSQFGNFLGGVFTAYVTGVADTFKNVFDGVKQVFTGLISFVTGVFTGDWSKAWNGVKDIFGGVFSSLVGLVKTPINKIIDMVNYMTGKLTSSLKISLPDWDVLPDSIQGKSFSLSIPKIPHLATGGLVTGDTLARIGEGGYNEAVLPLDRNTGWMDTLANKVASKSGGPSITVQADNMITDNNSAREFAKLVLGHIKDLERNYGDYGYGR